MMKNTEKPAIRNPSNKRGAKSREIGLWNPTFIINNRGADIRGLTYDPIAGRVIVNCS
jgi:hypothetical protein